MGKKQNSRLRFWHQGSAILLLLAGWISNLAAQHPDFLEVYDLLRTNLAGVSESELNRAAVQGLLSQFQPQVSLVGDAGASATNGNNGPMVAASVYDGAYASVRISQFGPDTVTQFSQTYDSLASSNRLRGLVLDLRFAAGDHYAVAVGIADRFFTNQLSLLDWGEGMRKSTPKAKAINLPLAILVNQKTRSAAEALAAILREHETGLILGSKTAGQANIAREFVLKSGQRLRIATAPVKLTGDKPLPLNGLTPDIAVEVNPADELAWFADAYKNPARPERLAAASAAFTNELSGASTNRQSRRRLNEAELVRMQRDGQSIELETNRVTRDALPAKPVLQDPALARALDLLKGLAVVQQFRAQ